MIFLKDTSWGVSACLLLKHSLFDNTIINELHLPPNHRYPVNQPIALFSTKFSRFGMCFGASGLPYLQKPSFQLTISILA
jgi:hypothetical protein